MSIDLSSAQGLWSGETMFGPTVPLPPRAEYLFPRLTPAQIDRLAVHGRTRQVRAGDILVEAGDPDVPFIVVTGGAFETVRPLGAAESPILERGGGDA